MLSKQEVDKFYQVMMDIQQKKVSKGDAIFEGRMDEVWSDIGDEAVAVCKNEGFFPMWHFVDAKINPYRIKWTAPEPPQVTYEGLALREEIEKDLELRLKMGHTGFAFNSSSSIEDQAKAQWNRDPNLRQEFFGNFDAYRAYLKAEAEGRVRFAGSKIIRGDIDERQPFGNP
jgi:hypothetical protein